VKISCPSCSAKYSISDEKVVSRLAKIRCRKCGATIVIDGKVNPPNVTTSAGGDAPDAHEHAEAAGTEYSVDMGEGDQRTMSLADIVAAYNAGQITGETYVWADGFADWKPLSDVQDIVEALHSPSTTTARGSAPQAAPPPAQSPWEAKPQATPNPPRAAAKPVRGGASDLFGRIEKAGAEDDVSTSAPEGATGSRNESSVLFSLSALTSASKPSQTGTRSSGGATSAASREDSGLIDLKALTAAAVKAEPAAAGIAPPAMAPLAASPLGMGSPLGLGSPLGTAGLIDQSPAKSKTGLYLAIGLVVSAVIIALAVILKPTPPPVVVAPPAPPPPAPALPSAAPTPTLAATPPPTGSPSAEPASSAEAPKKKASTGGGAHHAATGGGTKKPSTSSGSGDGDSSPAPAPKPKTGNCGCAAGDLQCAMRCSAHH
jgi:predicted Zn finger-like uncharacterized protein